MSRVGGRVHISVWLIRELLQVAELKLGRKVVSRNQSFIQTTDPDTADLVFTEDLINEPCRLFGAKQPLWPTRVEHLGNSRSGTIRINRDIDTIGFQRGDHADERRW